MSWRCRKTQDALAPYLDEQLSQHETAAVEAHLAGCPACQSELDRMEQALSLLHSAPPLRPPPSFAPRVKAHVRAVAGGPRSPLVRRGVLQGVCYGLVLGAAAAAALAVFSPSLVVQSPGAIAPGPQVAEATQPRTTPVTATTPVTPVREGATVAPRRVVAVASVRASRSHARSAEPAVEPTVREPRGPVQPSPASRNPNERAPKPRTVNDEPTPPVMPGFDAPKGQPAGPSGSVVNDLSPDGAVGAGPEGDGPGLVRVSDPASGTGTPTAATAHSPAPGGAGTGAIAATSDVNLDALLSPQPLPD